jgi:hypothetical protein
MMIHESKLAIMAIVFLKTLAFSNAFINDKSGYLTNLMELINGR